ncbi:MAG: hypothetical protein RIT81_41985 [Deltaproteobacteria bacterium]
MLLTVLSAAACAPLVSNRDFSSRDVHPASSAARRQAAVTAAPKPKPVVVAKRKPAPVAKAAPAPAAKPAPAPVAAPAPAPAPKPVLVAARAPEPEVEVTEDVEEEVAPRSFYAFTKSEIKTLRRRSKKFDRVFKKHRRCTKRTVRLIEKRGRLRDQIIDLQNRDILTPRQKQKLKRLRDREWKMKNDHSAMAACEPLERQLTDMLRETYETTAQLDY